MLGIAPLYPTRWPLARDTRLEFSMRHLGLTTLGGSFERVRGLLHVDQANALRRLDLVVDAGSLTTRDPERDARLRAMRLFGDDAHPSLRFRSTWAYEKGGGRRGLQGTLTMHGSAHVVELIAEPARVAADATGRRWYEATVAGTIDRRAWGVGLRGPLIGRDVHVRLYVRAAVPGVRPR